MKCKQCESEHSKLSDDSRCVDCVFAELNELRQGIRDAGFGIMKTSAGYSIHDVSERARIEEERTADIIADNIDLEIQVKKLNEELAALRASSGSVCSACGRYTPYGCSPLHESQCDSFL